MRIPRAEYEAIDLRAHSLLADVPLHDVWATDLAGGRAGRTMADLRALLATENLVGANAAVKILFALRGFMGRVFGWDAEPAEVPPDSFLAGLSDDDRESSLVAPGTPDGPFRVLFVSSRESISEIQNPTVHAFSVFVLLERESGYRFYWGIYVQPVGRITSWYMALIDPFRRFIIYPAILRYIRNAWARDDSEAAPARAT